MQFSKLIPFTLFLLSPVIAVPALKPASTTPLPRNEYWLDLHPSNDPAGARALQARGEYWVVEPDPWHGAKRQDNGPVLDPSCVQNDKGTLCTYTAQQVAAFNDQKGSDVTLDQNCVEMGDGGVVCAYPDVGV